MGGGDLWLPPGFRFHPTDEELVMHYLCRKCTAQPIAVPIIAEIDLYRHDPWQLPGMARYGEKEWYFFSPRDRKYPNGSRPNRAAGTGYWKATGADKPIGVPKPVGIKKALVFYAGKAPKGEKTNWIMHEYRLADVDRSARRNNSLRLDDWVLCRIYNKKGASERQLSSDRRATPAASRNTWQVPPPPMSLQQFPKQEVHMLPTPSPSHPQKSEYMYFNQSDSTPRLHTDSSCSDHVVSPTEIPCEREVQSQPTTWKRDWDSQLELPVDAMAPSSFPQPQEEQGLMSPVFRDPVLHDIFMYLQKPL